MEPEIKQLGDQAVRCCAELASAGWREYPNQFRKYARCFFKRFETPTRCHRNDDKSGVQIQIVVGDGFAGNVSMVMGITAGLKDETWLIIHNYSLPKTVAEVTALIPRMLAVWEAAANFNTFDRPMVSASNGGERLPAKQQNAQRE